MNLKDKNVIISGASRGIGKAIALHLAKEGANISFNYLKSIDEAFAIEKEIGTLGVKAKSFQADIKDFEAVKKWVNDTKEIFGTIDIVINNAGIIRDKALMLMDVSDWKDVINTNLDGVFNLTKATLVTLLKQKSGNIVNITSVSGKIGLPRQTNYSAAKAGIIGFTKALAKEVGPYNIRVNAVAPGFIETDMLKDLKKEYVDMMLAQVPLGRFGKAEEVAKVVKFLVSEESKYVTGQTIVIDGGMCML